MDKSIKTAPRLLTAEEMNKLLPFEGRFRTAIESNYSRGLTLTSAAVLNGILRDSGRATFPRAGLCAPCSLDLLQKLGRVYFRTKEEKFGGNSLCSK